MQKMWKAQYPTEARFKPEPSPRQRTVLSVDDFSCSVHCIDAAEGTKSSRQQFSERIVDIVSENSMIRTAWSAKTKLFRIRNFGMNLIS